MKLINGEALWTNELFLEQNGEYVELKQHFSGDA